MISQREKELLFERLSTPRPASKIVHKSAWHSQQQQQQDTPERSASGTRKPVRKEEQGTPTDDPELPSVRKLMRSTESLVEKVVGPDFGVDLRIEGIGT